MLERAVFGIIGTGARHRFSATKFPCYSVVVNVGMLLIVNVNIGNMNHHFIPVFTDKNLKR